MVNVLFLCTHNSARSVIAEVLLNTLSKGKFTGFSAGSSPKTDVNPIAREIAEEMRYDTKKLYSKSWDEFAKPNAPKMHIVITVCDSAAKEMCPIWPGHPLQVHWGFKDPSAAALQKKCALFGQVIPCKFIGVLKTLQLQVVIKLKNVKHLMN
ncbi:MAG: arsenate reductase ArsC [Pelagibacterales bacterium]|nr:arsenate reductase ArsC [Pelagibacterales bacterium]